VHLQLGIPILGMELMLGQVLQRGAVDALAMLNARAWGIGVAATLGSFLLASYYSAIMSWVWVFLLGSMNEVLPWSDGRAASFFYGDLLGQSAADVAAAEGTVVGGDGFGAPLAAAPLAGGLGPCKWWLVLGLGLNWLVCYACIFNGVESAGKAVWITMPLPYVLLFVLLVKGATLRGAGEGLTFYLWQWKGDAIADGSTWGDAVAQIFFGLGIACGIMPAYTSGCPEKEKIGRNAWIIGIANSATSIYAGFVSFAFLGHLAYTEGKSVADVAQGGWGLAFVVYPTAMGLFGPGAGQFFAVCFWLMLLALGVDSAFSLIESPICVVCDRFEWCAANRRITSAAACFSCFLVGLPMTTEGGYFVRASCAKWTVSPKSAYWRQYYETTSCGLKTSWTPTSAATRSLSPACSSACSSATCTTRRGCRTRRARCAAAALGGRCSRPSSSGWRRRFWARCWGTTSRRRPRARTAATPGGPPPYSGGCSACWGRSRSWCTGSFARRASSGRSRRLGSTRATRRRC
jgi:SNF family Na+-dependent transporter